MRTTLPPTLVNAISNWVNTLPPLYIYTELALKLTVTASNPVAQSV